ncbi:MAG: hypothetical protein H6Q66_2493 [Firmicutes bacterium]|nr:hypothetical protein [Bacillota bacterium]
MIVYNTPYFNVLLIASVVNAFLAVYAYYHRRNKIGAIPYIGIVLALTFYSLGYAFEISSSTLEEVILWLRVEYLGIAFFPALWLLLVWEYVGADNRLNRPLVVGLFVIPVITLVLHYTNDAHHWFYKEIVVEARGDFFVASLAKGSWYWVNLAYTYFSLIYGNLLLLQTYRRVTSSHKLQVASMMIGSLLPLIGNFIYLAGYSPWGIDLSPFMIAFSSPLYAWSLFQFRLFDLVPIARDKVFEGIREGVVVLDEQNRIADFNPAAHDILPELSTDSIGKPIDEIVSHAEFMTKILLDIFEFEIKTGTGKDDRYFHSRVSPITNRRGILIGKTIVLRDITERVLLLEKLHSLAMIDETTQIYNRRKFTQASIQEIVQARSIHKPVAAILFDVDFFKQINDNYGHAAGDLMLYTIAQRCKENLRPTDLIGRYGGEEFAVCLANTAHEEACAIAERLRLLISGILVRFENRYISVTASFGVTATLDANNMDLDKLLREADHALYSAKETGRNCVVLYREQPANTM